MDSRFQRSTTIKYVLALMLIALLSVCGNYMLHKVIQQQKSTAAIVNAAGRRRMTSQQIVYYSHLFTTSKDMVLRAEARTKLETALAKYQKNHLGLLNGDSELGLPGHPSANMQAYYFGAESNLDGLSREFTGNAYRLLWAEKATPEAAAEIADLGTNRLLVKLDKAVGLYQEEAEATSARLNEFENVLLVLTLLILGAEAIFVFRPLTASISRLISRLEEGRNAFKRLLDNSGQGFFSIDRTGHVGEEYSRTAEEIFGMKPAGKHLAEVFRQSEERWNAYVSVLFNESVSFKSLTDVCPASIEIDSLILELSYKQVRDSDNNLTGILVIATDVTALKAVERKVELERQTNKALLTILSSKNQFIDILELITQLEAPLITQQKAMSVMHTLKGGFAFFECREIAKLCHDWEEKLKVDFQQHLLLVAHKEIHALTEAFIKRHDNILGMVQSRNKFVKVDTLQIDRVVRNAVKYRSATEVVNSIHRLKEVSIEEALSWLNKATRTAARDVNKEVLSILWRSTTTIAPDDYSDLLLSLIHVVRNSVDHGLETPEKRRELGKNRRGQIAVTLEDDGEFLRLKLSDDGRGVDVSAVRAKAAQRGLNIAGRGDSDILDLLFHIGFSTKETATEMSGRGIGLNVVREEARKLGGDVRAINSPGQGLEIEIWFQRRSAVLSAASTAA